MERTTEPGKNTFDTASVEDIFRHYKAIRQKYDIQVYYSEFLHEVFHLQSRPSFLLKNRWIVFRAIRDPCMHCKKCNQMHVIERTWLEAQWLEVWYPGSELLLQSTFLNPQEVYLGAYYCFQIKLRSLLWNITVLLVCHTVRCISIPGSVFLSILDFRVAYISDSLAVLSTFFTHRCLKAYRWYAHASPKYDSVIWTTKLDTSQGWIISIFSRTRPAISSDLALQYYE